MRIINNGTVMRFYRNELTGTAERIDALIESAVDELGNHTHDIKYIWDKLSDHDRIVTHVFMHMAAQKIMDHAPLSQVHHIDVTPEPGSTCPKGKIQISMSGGEEVVFWFDESAPVDFEGCVDMELEEGKGNESSNSNKSRYNC